VAEAIDYAVNNGASILSNSWGMHNSSVIIRDAIARAEGKGALFVAAAGNERDDSDKIPHYPSGYDLPNIISVLATTEYERLAAYSNYGEYSVDLGAPGNYIYSTVPNNTYKYKSGTSMATPFVSGAAALIWKVEGGSYNNVKNKLLDKGRPLNSLVGKCVTGKMLDICFIKAEYSTIASFQGNLHQVDNFQGKLFWVVTLNSGESIALKMCSRELQKQAEELNGRSIAVKGSLFTKELPEERQMRTMQVMELEPNR
jgi:subtilisin family serine protease